MSIADDILQRVDDITGENVNYKIVTEWKDGTPMTDGKTDGVIYRKKGSVYYKRQYEGYVYARWFGVKGDNTIGDRDCILKALDFITDEILMFDGKMNILLENKIEIVKPILIKIDKGVLFKSGFISALRTDGLIEIKSDNVEIENLTVDCNGNNHVGIKAIDSESIILTNPKSLNAGYVSGIWIENCQKCEIVNPIILENQINDGSTSVGAIYVNNSEEINITNPKINNFKGKGINYRLSKNSTVFLGSINDVASDYADALYCGFESENVKFLNVNVKNAGGNLIKFSRNAKSCFADNCNFEGNVGSTAYGVLFQGTTYCKVSNSTIKVLGDKTSVINLDHPDPEGGNSYFNSLKDCEIFSENTTKAVVKSDINSTYDVGDFEIKDNKIKGGFSSIEIYTKGSKVTGNHISEYSDIGIRAAGNISNSIINNNILKGNNVNNSLLINPTSVCENVDVVDNTFLDCSYTAIYVINIDGFKANDNYIKGNSTASTIGISIESNVKNATLNNNNIRNFPVAGVFSLSNNENINIGFNQFKNIPDNPIYVELESGSIIGNSYENCGQDAINNDLKVVRFGNSNQAIYQTTPDGSAQYLIKIDNSGVFTSTLV